MPYQGSLQGKIWGNTRLLFGMNGVEAHFINVVKGGYCSSHFHKFKWNRFVVLSGKLEVTVVYDGINDITVLECGFSTDIPPGVVHKFRALEDTKCLEFYWTELDQHDIDRRGTVGGVDLLDS